MYPIRKGRPNERMREPFPHMLAFARGRRTGVCNKPPIWLLIIYEITMFMVMVFKYKMGKNSSQVPFIQHRAVGRETLRN